MSRILDYIFNKFGTREIEYINLGHNDFKTKRIWTLKLFKKEYTRVYDKDFG